MQLNWSPSVLMDIREKLSPLWFLGRMQNSAIISYQRGWARYLLLPFPHQLPRRIFCLPPSQVLIPSPPLFSPLTYVCFHFKCISYLHFCKDHCTDFFCGENLFLSFDIDFHVRFVVLLDDLKVNENI